MRSKLSPVPTAVGLAGGLVDGYLSAKRPNLSWGYELALGAVGFGLGQTRRYSALSDPLVYGSGFELSARAGYALADKVRAMGAAGGAVGALPASVPRGIVIHGSRDAGQREPAGLA